MTNRTSSRREPAGASSLPALTAMAGAMVSVQMGASFAKGLFPAVGAQGATALRMQDQVGSLEPGKQADIVVFGTDNFDLRPLHNPARVIGSCEMTMAPARRDVSHRA